MTRWPRCSSIKNTNTHGNERNASTAEGRQAGKTETIGGRIRVEDGRW